MKDQSKTKHELIQELSSLRRKVSEIERLESVFRKAEMRLSAVNECLLSLGDDVGDNIMRLTALAGELMGATASIYNRLEGDMLVAVGQWQTPADFKAKDGAQGHICYDVIRKNEERIVHIRNLAETPYAETDPNVCAYGLVTYIGHVVRWGSEPVGSLCVVFQRDLIPTADDERLLGILASSLGAEEKRWRNENALRESEEKYRNILENIDEAYFELDLKGNMTFCNDSTCHIGGYPRSELMNMNYRQYTSPEVAKMLSVVFENIYKTGERGSLYDFELIRKDKSTRNMELSVNLMRNSEGDAIGFRCIARDITERKRAEEALHESAERYRAFFETSRDCVFISSPEGRWIDLNDAAVDLFGYSSREELKNVHIPDLYADPEGRNRFIAQMREKGYVKDSPFDMRKKDGSIIHVLLTSVLWKDADGNVLGYRGTIRDVTEKRRIEKELRAKHQELSAAYGQLSAYDEELRRKYTELLESQQSLQESEKRYRELTDFLPISIFEVDAAGSIATFNRTALEVFRYSQEDYKEGMNALQFFSPEEWQRVGENIGKVFQGISVTDQEYTFVRKDGSTFIGLTYSSPKIHENKTVGIRGAMIDITERKRAEGESKLLEERLQQAEKMQALGTLAGGVAHDLNNVLGVLVGYSELLLQNVPQESPFQRHAMQIFKGSLRAAAIIQDLLTLARRGVLVSETLNLNSVISDFLQMPEFESIRHHHPGVQFKTSLDAELLNVKGSSIHLSKTVMNLLSNAAEAITGLGEVLITTENRYVERPIHGYDTTKEGEYAVLTVSDTGSGISSSDIGRIFEPFYTKKVMGRSGTGLGLAVVWGTVKDHNGYIDVQSTEGRGTIFTLYFPITREDLTKAEQVVPQSTYMGRGEHILVVDDVESQRLLASVMLDSLGYKVSSVAGGEEAIEFVKNKPVDLLILDMIMDPGMDGLDTYRSILDIRPQQKAIIVSGFSETDRVHAAQSLGAGAYVRKPYVMEKLGLAVKKELDK